MNAIRREFAVAFSRHAQPLCLRIVKWVVLIGVAVALRGTSYFWTWMLGLPMLGLAVHFFYRWKTHAWTRPWGGWNDLPSARD